MVCFVPRAWAQKSVTLEELMSAPFPENLTAAKTGNRIAWTFNQEGKRTYGLRKGQCLARAGLRHISKMTASRFRM